MPLTSLDLPVAEVLPALRSALASHDSVLLSAPPGAGKSTLVPLALLDEPWLEGQKILMLEPRRLAARTLAERMASMLGERVGQTVGYRVRFESRVGPQTRIEILTEGILTRMIQHDQTLEGVGLVVFDEFHERSLFAETALAFCREAQQVLRPDLRLLVMSATLDLPRLSALLDAPIVESRGRQYPIDVRYGEGFDDVRDAPLHAARATARIFREEPAGDILVFLPGEAEIRRCLEALEAMLPEARVLPLYGSLTPREQQEAIVPDREGRRKVVLATSIAETSLTIEGIRIVVDTGLGRTSRFNPNTGLTRLETMPVSRDRADQRAGRAGRLGPGIALRLWTRATHDRLDAHRMPEIEEADLAPLLLDLAAWAPPTPPRSRGSRLPRRPIWRRPPTCCAASTPSTRPDASPPKGNACIACRATRAWRTCSYAPASCKLPPWQPTWPPCSRSATRWGATPEPTSRSASTSCADAARRG